MPDFIRHGASVTAGVLEAAAGQLRKLSENDDDQPVATVTAIAPDPAKADTKPRPAAGTRSRIANPKAAKKVRAREG